MTQKNDIRIDYHFADNADPAFIGVFVTTKAAYEAGEAAEGEDVVQLVVNPRDKVACDLLEAAAESACSHANESAPTSAAQAFAIAGTYLHKGVLACHPAVADLRTALMNAAHMIAAQKMTDDEPPEQKNMSDVQTAEELQVLQHALGNFIELMNEPNSADRANNPEQADRQIMVARKLLNDIDPSSEFDVHFAKKSADRPRG